MFKMCPVFFLFTKGLTTFFSYLHLGSQNLKLLININLQVITNFMKFKVKSTYLLGTLIQI